MNDIEVHAGEEGQHFSGTSRLHALKVAVHLQGVTDTV